MIVARRKATHARHYCEAPQIIEANGARHWITRAANFVAVVSEVPAGARIDRVGQDDEHMVFLPASAASITAGTEQISATKNSLTIVPPGDSSIIVEDAGTVVRVFSAKAGDLAAQAVNAAIYADGAPEIVPIVAWPDPVGGFRLRNYRLDEVVSLDPSPLKMRLFRSTNLMINIFEPWARRRDVTKLSPHWHDDFEQMSLALTGSFAHHLRYPWGPDMTGWIEDEHVQYDSPSILVIPAGVIHTTQDTGTGTTWLVDIFGPPRMDFSSRAGFVLNADDYPMPT